ncbi:MAG: serine hydrolase [Planctomycetaceae bacterium]|nr:serine hydrolase [Planctomycetaceae bacterium]
MDYTESRTALLLSLGNCEVIMRGVGFIGRTVGLGLVLVSLISPRLSADLKDDLLPRLKSHRGRVAVAVKHLKTGERFDYQSEEPMPTASLIKLPVMIEAYKQVEEGKQDLENLITLKAEDKVPGSGILTPHFSEGMKLSLRDAIRLMIAYSDNTATNLVLDQVGLKSPNERMDQLGHPETKINAKVYRRSTSIAPERSEKYGLGSTTAKDMVALLEQLHAGKLANEAHTTEMIDHLLKCENTTRLPGLLPDGIKVAHKTGSVSRVRTESGIIFSPSGPIAICVLTASNQDQRWSEENSGHRLCSSVAKIAFDHFNPKRGIASTGPRELKLGDYGLLVEDLQRTLNTHRKADEKISVDGEFGEETQTAVRRFQETLDLKPTGVVASDTWNALGPLITSDPPVPAPDEINKAKLPVAEADPLVGPPLVTCKAWAIADAKTGKLLKGSQETDSRDIASTTKIMTAYLVLRHAEEHPEVLKETVTFSDRADRTGGSSAKIRAGERLTVEELLYGLMLPSGNDASVALAEHFGKRLATDQSDSGDPLDQFIAAMNRMAEELGMKNTTYKNPHGLTARGHRSTAEDLTKLAFAAIQLPKFRHYINTRQHGCTLEGPSGYQRNILWKNTNQLLGIQGFQGVKTGTTSAAGACLVSWGTRDESSIILVVLGATSSDARYVDSRNLYRWWWRGGKEQ